MRHISCCRCRRPIPGRNLTIVRVEDFTQPQDFTTDPYVITTKDLCRPCADEHRAWLATPPASSPAAPSVVGREPVTEGPTLPAWLGGSPASPSTAATVGS